MDVIIFSGQSNMQGQSECLSENEIVENAFEYKWLTDEAVPLCNPVGENITNALGRGYFFTQTTRTADWLGDHVAGASCYGHTNLVPAFCRTYTRRTGREVLAVHVPKGSTRIEHWLPGTPGYDIVCKKSLGAIRLANPAHIYFVWLQGESDACAGNSKAYYKNAIETLCRALIKDVGIQLFGIIRVGPFAGDERDLEIIAAQDEICRENPDFAMLTDIASELYTKSEYMNPKVRGHFGARGLELLGEMAAQGLCSVIPENIP